MDPEWDLLRQPRERWPNDRPPRAPRIQNIPDKYGWPSRPDSVNVSNRGYAVEGSVMSLGQYIPDHQQSHDARDPDDDRLGDPARIEITHALRRVSEERRPGRLHVTGRQARQADRIAWRVILRDDWRVVWAAEYDTVVLQDLCDRYSCSRIPWTAVLDAVTPSGTGNEHARQTGYICSGCIMDVRYDV